MPQPLCVPSLMDVRVIEPSAFYRTYTDIFELLRADTQALREETYRLRYQVYCVEKKFLDSTENPNDMEMDCYDERSVHYLLRHRPSGVAVGTVRLILPNESDLQRSFPLQAISDIPALKDPDHIRKTCEISRFCISQILRKRVTDSLYGSVQIPDSLCDSALSERRRVVNYAALGLIRACIEVMQEHGIAEAYQVCEPALSRVLSMIGISSRPVGAAIEYHGLRQPVIVNDRETLTNTLQNAPDVWEVLSDRGRLHVY